MDDIEYTSRLCLYADVERKDGTVKKNLPIYRLEYFDGDIEDVITHEWVAHEVGDDDVINEITLGKQLTIKERQHGYINYRPQ